MPSNTTYSPATWDAVETSKVLPNAIGITDTATAGQTTDIDYELEDDVLIRGIEFMAENPSFGDTVTIKVIDVDGNVLGQGNNFVVNTPVLDWNISDAHRVIGYESVVPNKGLTGLTIRTSYTSIGENNVEVGINFLFVKVLV